MIDEAPRCGYSRCRAELPAPGPQGGRPRTFCRDTRWDGGRTCGQMARSERDALDALGLDSSRASFGLDADRLREHVDAVRGPVTALAEALERVTARIDEVEAHAVAAVEAANKRVAAAEVDRVAAQERQERAEQDARASREHVEVAGQERAAAVERAAAAARQALEATEALGAARQRADEALAVRDVEREAARVRIEAADRVVAAARRSAEDAALRAERAEALGAAAERQARERQAETAAEVVGLRAELDSARAVATAAVAERDAARADTERLAADVLTAERTGGTPGGAGRRRSRRTVAGRRPPAGAGRDRPVGTGGEPVTGEGPVRPR